MKLVAGHPPYRTHVDDPDAFGQLAAQRQPQTSWFVGNEIPDLHLRIGHGAVRRGGIKRRQLRIGTGAVDNLDRDVGQYAARAPVKLA